MTPPVKKREIGKLVVIVLRGEQPSIRLSGLHSQDSELTVTRFLSQHNISRIHTRRAPLAMPPSSYAEPFYVQFSKQDPFCCVELSNDPTSKGQTRIDKAGGQNPGPSPVSAR